MYLDCPFTCASFFLPTLSCRTRSDFMHVSWPLPFSSSLYTNCPRPVLSQQCCKVILSLIFESFLDHWMNVLISVSVALTWIKSRVHSVDFKEEEVSSQYEQAFLFVLHCAFSIFFRSWYRWSGSGSGGRHSVRRGLLPISHPHPLPPHHWPVRDRPLPSYTRTHTHLQTHTTSLPLSSWSRVKLQPEVC